MGLQSLKEIISIHPLFVHFPIALLLLSAVFYGAGALFKNENLTQAGRWTLYAGMLSAVIAVLTGIKAESTVEHDEEAHEIMELHEKLGYIILALSAALSAWTLAVKSAIPSKGRIVFFAGLIVLSLVIIQQADLGGRLVFLKGIGVGKKSMLQEDGHSHDHH